MRFFLSPFVFVFELIGFLISAAFVYGLVLIVAFAILLYGIADLRSGETIVKTVTAVEMHEVTKFVDKGPELICTRVTGFELFPNAKTEREYCPTCVMK